MRATPQPEKRDALTIVEDTRAITGGVDAHADMHVAAALDAIGGLFGVQEFRPPAGYARLLGWLGGFGAVALVGIKVTGSCGAGRPGTWPRPASGWWRWTARTAAPPRHGNSDPLDAVSAARPAQSGRARGARRAATAPWRRSVR